MKLQIITILKNKDNVSNPLFIKAMGGYTINPVFLNKILSMAETGIGWSHYINTRFKTDGT